MKKLIILLICLFVAPISAQMKPMLGELPDASQFDMPVAIWLFNEGAGSIVNDLSGNRNTGTLVADTHWVSGKFGSALSFDGTGDWVTTTKGSSYGLGIRQNATYCVWIKPASLAGGDQEIISCFNNVVGVNLRLADGDSIEVFVYPNNHRIYVANIITLDWQFVCLTLDANVSVWRNGEFQDSAVLGEDIGDGGTLRIGASAANGNPYVGLIDNVMVFDRTLTAQQIAQLYRDPFPWFERDPIEIWEAAIAAPPGGQVIFINLSSMGYGLGGFGLVFVLAVIRKMRSKKRQVK